MKVFLLILLLIFTVTGTFADEIVDERINKLILRAKVLEAVIDKSDETYPRCNLKLEVTFINEGKEPIIILHSLDDSSNSWVSGLSISAKYLYDGENGLTNTWALPSICVGCYDDLKKKLNKNNPPAKYSRILKFQQSWTFIDKQSFALGVKTKVGSSFGWEEVANSNWKINGTIGYSLFPNNLGDKFRENLRRQWQKYGVLYFHGTHSVIESRKFEIDLSRVKF